ncbi:MAG: xlnA 7, partial [Myxococcaceae bacterium]|nr:xlnA 7 [Myxococcaceae bacterium]
HPLDRAAGRAARASSTYDSGHAAANAADGDMRTGWSPGGTDASPWWQVDLGASADVRGVEVVTRWELDQAVTRQNFAVWLSDDPDFATHAVFGAYGTPALAHRAIWSHRLPAAAPANRYRYVRVVKTAAEYFYLGDVRVLALP